MVCISLLQFFPASISLGVSWLSYFSDIFGGGTFCGLIMGSIVGFAVSIDPLRLFWLINWNDFYLEVSFAFDVLGFLGVGLKSTSTWLGGYFFLWTRNLMELSLSHIQHICHHSALCGDGSQMTMYSTDSEWINPISSFAFGKMDNDQINDMFCCSCLYFLICFFLWVKFIQV